MPSETLKILGDPQMWAIYRPGVLAGMCTVVMCSLVSPLVAVKRLGFIGQGVSHCAFGGVGVAAVLAALGVIATGSAGEFVVIAVFCIAAALGMGALAERRRTPEDTTIGLFLVASMAVGGLLVIYARTLAMARGRAPDVRSWESILFGSVMGAGEQELALAAIVLAIVLAAAFLLQRPLLFWAFDEEAARAFGVPGRAMRAALMIGLALIVVTAMKTAGVVLASALLVLPGATALKLSDKLVPVTLLSLGFGLLGLLAGLVLSVECDLQSGPCVVLVMTSLFAASLVLGPLLRPRVAAPAAAAPQ